MSTMTEREIIQWLKDNCTQYRILGMAPNEVQEWVRGAVARNALLQLDCSTNAESWIDAWTTHWADIFSLPPDYPLPEGPLVICPQAKSCRESFTCPHGEPHSPRPNCSKQCARGAAPCMTYVPEDKPKQERLEITGKYDRIVITTKVWAIMERPALQDPSKVLATPEVR